MALVRLNKELSDIIKKPPLGITAGPKNNSNLMEWVATMVGPSNTPYADALFTLKILFLKTYPFSAPKVVFVTPIYHCNINQNGDICLDILKDNWSPALTIDKVLLSISSLLADPNPGDPLMPAIAHQLRTNKPEHDRIAREHAQDNAMNGLFNKLTFR
jgi:ubiquitin-protein ligase